MKNHYGLFCDCSGTNRFSALCVKYHFNPGLTEMYQVDCVGITAICMHISLFRSISFYFFCSITESTIKKESTVHSRCCPFVQKNKQTNK